jgi:polar amino acid transport system permease protein
MTTQTNTERARPEAIKAVPVRHPGRWVMIVVIAVLVAMFIHLIVTNDHFMWRFIFSSYAPGKRGVMFTDPVLRGLRGTILLTVTSMLIGIALGVVVAIMRLSPNPILKTVAWGYTWVFRAVPRLVLAILFGNLGVLWPRVGFGIPFGEQIGHFFGLDGFTGEFYSIRARDLLAGFIAGMLALGLSEAAYMAEIVRAGIESIEEGQSEAAAALGMSRIVLPQAMRVIVPPTGNETIAMVKDTSLVAFVPVTGELFFQLNAISSRTFIVLPVLVAACLWYLIICSVLMIGQFFVERHFSRGYGTTGRARQRLRDIGVEQGGAVPPLGRSEAT